MSNRPLGWSWALSRGAIVVLVGLQLASRPVFGQTVPDARPTPSTPRQPYDVLVFTGAGSLGAARGESRFERWGGSALVGAALGRHWTAHAKTEVQLVGATAAELFLDRVVYIPAVPYPIFQTGVETRRITSLAVTQLYQFGENAWFHPHVGAGLALDVDRQQVRYFEVTGFGGPGGAVTVPADDLGRRTSFRAAAIVTAGFKQYVAERAFLRSDLSVTLSRNVTRVLWRVGAGFDF